MITLSTQETVTKKEAIDFPKILYVGASGKGKTYSFRNMNPETTGFINVELKPLPFKNNFKFHAKPKKFEGLIRALEDYSKNPEIECIVIDSLSAAFELLLKESRDIYSGWDVWNHYNKKIGELLNKIKMVEKEVFATAHYEVLTNEVEGGEKRVKIKGKEWEGMIEKEFTFVLYAQDKYKSDIPSYFLKLAGEGISAKCPPDVFGHGIYVIDNDSKMVLEKIREFYNN